MFGLREDERVCNAAAAYTYHYPTCIKFPVLIEIATWPQFDAAKHDCCRPPAFRRCQDICTMATAGDDGNVPWGRWRALSKYLLLWQKLSVEFFFAGALEGVDLLENEVEEEGEEDWG